MTHEERLAIARELAARILETYGEAYIHRGILIEISYDQESTLLRDAARLGPRWPQQADEYRRQIVLFERDGWTARLDEAVAASDRADPPSGRGPGDVRID
jgi:hypothetical protein